MLTDRPEPIPPTRIWMKHVHRPDTGGAETGRYAHSQTARVFPFVPGMSGTRRVSDGLRFDNRAFWAVGIGLPEERPGTCF